MKELTEKVTVTRVVPSPIKEMVLFVKALQGANVDIHSLGDEELIRRAREFWNFEHGED